MKKGFTLLLLILFTSHGLLFSQGTKDSLGGSYIYPQFHDSFSAEESWQIHKEAYVKQLKAEGLSDDEIEQMIATYEKKKEKFIAKAAMQRKQAEVQREKAEEQRARAEVLRQKADEQRKQAEIIRKQAEESRSMHAVEREKADKLRKEAEVQRKKAEVARQHADEARKKAEALRNSFENMLTEKITISKQSSTIDPITFKIDRATTLHFSINGSISSGLTFIEIFNPSGKKEGELSLEHKNKSAMEDDELLKFTSGALHKTISDTAVGNWSIKVSAQNAEGTVHLSVARYVKPALDE